MSWRSAEALGQGMRDWRIVLRRTKDEVKKDNLSLLAGGVSFYAFLSIFPALAALVSLYGILSDPSQVEEQVQAMSGVLPGQARELIQLQLSRLASSSSGALGFGAVFSMLLSLWSANKATKGLFQALSIVYGEREERSFLVMNGQSLATTLALIVSTVLALALVALFPVVVGSFGLGTGAQTLASIARWPILIALVLLALAGLYRFGPDGPPHRWRWVSPGALLATALWLAASVGFSIYAQSFANYDKMYGSMGAVVVLMLWLFISAYAVLLGAEVNAEIEQRTAQNPGDRRSVVA